MKTVALAEICDFASGGTPNRADESFYAGDIPWITGADIVGDRISPRSFITDSAIAGSAARIVPSGTVLLVTRTSVGKVAVADRDLSFSQDITALVPNEEKLQRRFLVHFLRSEQSYFHRNARGATIKGITRSVVRDLQIPDLPVSEQGRIADILDKVDTLRAKRREAIALLDALGQSIFYEMFGAADYPKHRLDAIADVVSGITKGRKVPVDVALATTPYLAVSNVQDMSLNLDVVKTIDVTETEINRYALQEDDLLMTEGGDPDKLGRGTLWTGEIAPCLHQNHIYRVRLKPGAQVLPMYLNWATATGSAKEYFLRCAKQTTGIASINKTQLSATPIPVPKLDLQQKFSVRIAAVENLKAKHRAQLAELDNLFLSLQDRAFKGEL